MKKKKKLLVSISKGKSWALYQAQIHTPWSWAWREDPAWRPKVTQGWRVSLHCMHQRLPVGFYTETATHTYQLSKQKKKKRDQAGITEKCRKHSQREIPQGKSGGVSELAAGTPLPCPTPLAPPPHSLRDEPPATAICAMCQLWPKGL